MCGVALPAGLVEASRLPEPIFTPATKAEQGEHDENVSFDYVVDKLGAERAEELRAATLRIYSEAAALAEERGLDRGQSEAREDADAMLADAKSRADRMVAEADPALVLIPSPAGAALFGPGVATAVVSRGSAPPGVLTDPPSRRPGCQPTWRPSHRPIAPNSFGSPPPSPSRPRRRARTRATSSAAPKGLVR